MSDGAPERRDPLTPPTAVRLLPVLIAVFGVNMLIDSTTDWQWWIRWIVAIAVGIVVQFIVVRIWASRQR